MTVTQYIGARYVPLFASPLEWDSANTYEALTIVLYEGNSYTSRQAVPAGIDITNETYWALTGNYNAQVAQYSQQVSQYTTQVSELETKVATNSKNITTLQNTLANIELTTDGITINSDIGGASFVSGTGIAKLGKLVLVSIGLNLANGANMADVSDNVLIYGLPKAAANTVLAISTGTGYTTSLQVNLAGNIVDRTKTASFSSGNILSITGIYVATE